jgi:hypothetical protein
MLFRYLLALGIQLCWVALGSAQDATIVSIALEVIRCICDPWNCLYVVSFLIILVTLQVNKQLSRLGQTREQPSIVGISSAENYLLQKPLLKVSSIIYRMLFRYLLALGIQLLGDFAGKQTIVASWADPRATQHSWIPNARRYLNQSHQDNEETNNIQTIPWVTNAPDYFQGYGAKAIGRVLGRPESNPA